MFSQLNVRDESNTQSRRKHSSAGVGAAVSSITVKPLSAPLATAVRPIVVATRPPPVSLPMTPAPHSRLHPFRTPSPQCPPVTLIPADCRIVHKVSERKILPLPRRSPHVRCSGRQSTSPSTLDFQTEHDSLSSSSRRSVRSVSSESYSSSPGFTTPEVLCPLLSDPPPFNALHSQLVGLC